MTNKEILKDITYEFLELPELRQAHILAEHISAARIDIKSKHGYEYGLFYYNYQDKFNLCVADNRDVSPISRYLVRRRIENMVKTKTNRGTNTISLEKAIDSEDIVRFTEECKKNFKEAEIAKLYLWEIKKGKLPEKKISAGYHKHWFLDEYAPTTTKD